MPPAQGLVYPTPFGEILIRVKVPLAPAEAKQVPAIHITAGYLLEEIVQGLVTMSYQKDAFLRAGAVEG